MRLFSVTLLGLLSTLRACVAIIALSIATAAMAEDLDVDWILYGSGVVGGRQSACFYDRNGLTWLSGTIARVWAKCLPMADIEHIDIEKDFDGRILNLAAGKLANNYIPPAASYQTMDLDAIISTIQLEITADIAEVEPVIRIFYELDCINKTYRELSIEVHKDGRYGFVDKPSNWKHTPPETNVARLSKLICHN